MGSYYIPSNKLKGESRILYIFTTKSLIYTAIGAAIGFIFYGIFTLVNLKPVGITMLAILAVLGFLVGTLKFPNGNSKLAKNVGGDSLDQIIGKYIAFKKKKKIYSYAIPRKDPDYSSGISSKLDLFNLNGLNNIAGLNNNQNKTKEDK